MSVGSRGQRGVVRLCGVVFIALVALSFPVACAPDPDGAVLFSEHCGSCHLDPLWPRAPHFDMMQGWNPEVIITALSSGIMEEQGRELSGVERTAVANYISLGLTESHPPRGEQPNPLP